MKFLESNTKRPFKRMSIAWFAFWQKTNTTTQVPNWMRDNFCLNSLKSCSANVLLQQLYTWNWINKLKFLDGWPCCISVWLHLSRLLLRTRKVHNASLNVWLFGSLFRWAQTKKTDVLLEIKLLPDRPLAPGSNEGQVAPCGKGITCCGQKNGSIRKRDTWECTTGLAVWAWRRKAWWSFKFQFNVAGKSAWKGLQWGVREQAKRKEIAGGEKRENGDDATEWIEKQIKGAGRKETRAIGRMGKSWPFKTNTVVKYGKTPR